MNMTLPEWEKYHATTRLATARPVTNEQRSEAIRAQSALVHPGFQLLENALLEAKTKMARQLEASAYRLTHGRGVDEPEMHLLREDIAHCSGWLNAIELALKILPDIVKAGTDS